MRDKKCISVLSRTCTDRNEATSLKNLVESSSIDNEVLDYWESCTSPRLYCNGSTILEMTHEKLTGCNLIIWSMCSTVDKE